ncbi:MAG: hypothetical protein KN64_01125 [Sulfurovum sp. AS07-7]|nr:MAG: hypothetical protein KN64_01125 [Sulfurovum sp. AS07-7]
MSKAEIISLSKNVQAVIQGDSSKKYLITDVKSGKSFKKIFIKKKENNLEIYSDEGDTIPELVIEDYQGEEILGLNDAGDEISYVGEEASGGILGDEVTALSLGSDTLFTPLNVLIGSMMVAGGAIGISNDYDSDCSCDTDTLGEKIVVLSTQIKDGGDGFLSKEEIDKGVQADIEIKNAKVGDILNVDTDGDGKADIIKVLTQEDIDKGVVTIDIPKEDIPANGKIVVEANISDVSGKVLAEGKDNSSTLFMTTNEDTPILFNATSFEELDNAQAIRVDKLPANGQLLFDGSPVLEGQEITKADIAKITFVPDANENGDNYATVTFSIKDNKGAFSSTSNTLSINVTPVNDQFTDTNEVETTLEDTPLIGNLLIGTSSVDGTVTVTKFVVEGVEYNAGRKKKHLSENKLFSLNNHK